MPDPVRLTIPERDREPLSNLVLLSDVGFAKLLKSLREANPTLDRAALARAIAPSVDMDPKQIRGIVRVLCVLVVVWNDAVPADAFASDVCSALRELGREELKDANWDEAKKRLATLVLLDSLAVVARGAQIAADNERLFCTARILTDIRPIFRRDVSTGPAGAIIQHVLRLSFHEEVADETSDFYVALSSSGVRELQAILARAAEKEDSLKKLLDSSKIPYLDLGDVHG